MKQIYTNTRAFATLGEARAFRDGIDYVNDSAITVVAIKQDKIKGWHAYILDRDSDEVMGEVKA